MIDHLRRKRILYIKKLVSNAKAIISNQIALPLGARKMDKIITWINQIEPLGNIDFQIFSEYNSKTSSFSIGTERLRFEREFLKKQDRQLDELTAFYKDTLLDKCFEILKKCGTVDKVIIDLEKIESIEQLHTLFQQQLNFPDFYGKNWDAFWDSTTLVIMPKVLTLSGWQKFESKFPRDSQILKDTIEQFNTENTDKMIERT